MYEEEFDRIRRVSQEMGCFSWTSREYQDDILQFLLEHSGRGYGVIEVGCYKGGLSALLGYLCRQLRWPFFTIDIDETAVASTQKLLLTLDLLEGTTIHHGGLDTFVQSVTLSERPALVILDGDHRYEAVVDDLNSVYKLNKLPHTAVFHDYSLRHPTSGERVDEAVRDCLGDWPVKNIGARMDGSGKYPTRDKPSEDGHWWNVPGSEGAIVDLPENMRIEMQQKPNRDKSVRSLISRVLARITG